MQPRTSNCQNAEPPPLIADAIRERTLGEKHAYLDGMAAGLRLAERYGWQKSETWLEVVEQIRESLEP